MKVTLENIKSIEYFPRNLEEDYDYETGQLLLKNLLNDLDEFNQLLDDQGENYMHLYIDYIDEHTQYSPERTDPCPDYYGYFYLRFEKNPYESVGDIMSLYELDNALCILTNFIEFKLS